MNVSKSVRTMAGGVLLTAATAALAGGVTKQTVDVLGQGLAPGACTDAPRTVASPEGATLVRTKGGITASFSMPTPEPASYCYPPANPFQPIAPTPGTPEAFTGWFFFFNHPENCLVPNNCVPAHPTDPHPTDFDRAGGGVYNFAGHLTGGGALNLVGHIEVGEAPFDGASPLERPMAAEVHLAVAPHGVVIPQLLPDQITKPVGGPPYWWVALFHAP
jgi:hypothetical protein